MEEFQGRLFRPEKQFRLYSETEPQLLIPKFIQWNKEETIILQVHRQSKTGFKFPYP